MMDFHRSRKIQIQHARRIIRESQPYFRWCFSDLTTARSFIEQFGGTLYTSNRLTASDDHANSQARTRRKRYGQTLALTPPTIPKETRDRFLQFGHRRRARNFVGIIGSSQYSTNVVDTRRLTVRKSRYQQEPLTFTFEIKRKSHRARWEAINGIDDTRRVHWLEKVNSRGFRPPNFCRCTERDQFSAGRQGNRSCPVSKL
jgi:hypothetical protein